MDVVVVEVPSVATARAARPVNADTVAQAVHAYLTSVEDRARVAAVYRGHALDTVIETLRRVGTATPRRAA